MRNWEFLAAQMLINQIARLWFVEILRFILQAPSCTLICWWQLILIACVIVWVLCDEPVWDFLNDLERIISPRRRLNTTTLIATILHLSFRWVEKCLLAFKISLIVRLLIWNFLIQAQICVEVHFVRRDVVVVGCLHPLILLLIHRLIHIIRCGKLRVRWIWSLIKSLNQWLLFLYHQVVRELILWCEWIEVELALKDECGFFLLTFAIVDGFVVWDLIELSQSVVLFQILLFLPLSNWLLLRLILVNLLLQNGELWTTLWIQMMYWRPLKTVFVLLILHRLQLLKYSIQLPRMQFLHLVH